MSLAGDTMRLVRRASRLDFIEGLGVSIGQRHVALAHLVKRLAAVTLQHHLVAPLPPMEQAEARRAALAEAVAGFVAERGISADRVFIALPRASALLSRLSLPAAARADLRQVVEFEIDRLLPVARDEIFYDFLARDAAGGEKLDVLVIAVPRRVVGEHTAALELAGARARSVSIAPVAVLDLIAFSSAGRSPCVVTLVDDGGTIEIDCFVRGSLAASHLVRADEVSSPASVARLVAEEASSAGAPREGVEVYSWRAGAPGGGAAGEAAAELPPETLASGPDLLRRAEGALSAPEGFFVAPDPALAPAIGVALAAVREGEAGLNLLPPEERRAVEEGAPLLTFLTAAVLVVVTLVWLVSAMVKDHRISSRLHRELAELEPAMRGIHRNEDEAKALRDKLKVLTQGDQRRISVFLRELTETVPQDAYLSSFRVRNDRIELEGFAKSASDLVPQLEKSKRFKNAQFTSPVTKVQNNQERFSLTTEIEE